MCETRPSAAVTRVPSLAEWLGEDVRADGFEEWTARQLGLPDGLLTDDESLWLRLAQTFSVACVEQINREAQRDDSPEAVGLALAMWSRVCGYVTITAVASVSRDDAYFRRLARILTEDFKIGAKMAADALANAAQSSSESPRHG